MSPEPHFKFDWKIFYRMKTTSGIECWQTHRGEIGKMYPHTFAYRGAIQSTYLLAIAFKLLNRPLAQTEATTELQSCRNAKCFGYLDQLIKKEKKWFNVQIKLNQINYLAPALCSSCSGVFVIFSHTWQRFVYLFPGPYPSSERVYEFIFSINQTKT